MDVDNYDKIKLAALIKEEAKNKEIISDLLKANKKLIQENNKLESIIQKSAKNFATDYLDTFKQNAKYKQALNKIEARIQLENADDCLLDIMEIIENIKEI